MPVTGKKLLSKILTVGVLAGALIWLHARAPDSRAAVTGECAAEVYDYCWAQGRNVDPETCTCNMETCFGLPASDCTEQGAYLNTNICVCVGNPGETNYCATDPYALGCPRSFDTVMGNAIRAASCANPPCDPMIGGGDADICSFGSYAWCNTNGGSWSSYGCSCSIPPGTTSAQSQCSASGGDWVAHPSSSGGGVCYNPSNFPVGSQCSQSTESMAACQASNGHWNGLTCHCTP
jgi:hypothetical protein